MSFALEQCVDGSRCVQCNHVCVDAWVCVDCSMDMALRRDDDDMRFASAGACGRAQQRLRDQRAAYEQHIDMQTVMDNGVYPSTRVAGTADDGVSDFTRSRKIKALRHAHSDFTGYSKWNKDFAAKSPEKFSHWPRPKLRKAVAA